MRKKLTSTSIYRKSQQAILGLLISIFIALSMYQCKSIATQSDTQPPHAKIIYSAQSSGDNWQLHLMQWPNSTEQSLILKSAGQYRPGTEIRSPLFSTDGNMLIFVGNRRGENGQETQAADPYADKYSLPPPCRFPSCRSRYPRC